MLSDEALGHIEVNAKALDDATGAQIVFVTLKTTKPTAIDDYCYKLFNEWGIGDAQKDNGLLVLLAIDDDDYYVMEGSGLERNLPPSELSALWNQHLEPDFARKDYSGGSVKFFDALFERIAGIYGANLSLNTNAASGGMRVNTDGTPGATRARPAGRPPPGAGTAMVGAAASLATAFLIFSSPF